MVATEFRGKVRARDPESSWAAAALQDLDRVDAVRTAILDLLRQYGPMCDELLVDRFEAYRFLHPSIPAATPQSIRTRRHALTIEGRVVNTGKRTATRSGSTATVWAVRDEH